MEQFGPVVHPDPPRHRGEAGCCRVVACEEVIEEEPLPGHVLLVNWLTGHEGGPRLDVANHVNKGSVDAPVTRVDGLVQGAFIQLPAAYEELSGGPGVVAKQAIEQIHPLSLHQLCCTLPYRARSRNERQACRQGDRHQALNTAVMGVRG